MIPEPHGAATWALLCLEGAGQSHHCPPQDPWRGVLGQQGLSGCRWEWPAAEAALALAGQSGTGTSPPKNAKAAQAPRHLALALAAAQALLVSLLQPRQGSSHLPPSAQNAQVLVQERDLTTLTRWLLQGLRGPIRRSSPGVPSTRPSLPMKGLFRLQSILALFQTGSHQSLSILLKDTQQTPWG